MSLPQKSLYIEVMTLKEIGRVVRERRKHLGVNQRTLTDLADEAVNTVVAIERGEGNSQLKARTVVLNTLGLKFDIYKKRLVYEAM